MMTTDDDGGWTYVQPWLPWWKRIFSPKVTRFRKGWQ